MLYSVNSTMVNDLRKELMNWVNNLVIRYLDL